MAARDPAKVERYQDAVARIKSGRVKPGSPEYNKNAEIIRTIGQEYGFSWQDKANFNDVPGGLSGEAPVSNSPNPGGTLTEPTPEAAPTAPPVADAGPVSSGSPVTGGQPSGPVLPPNVEIPGTIPVPQGTPNANTIDPNLVSDAEDKRAIERAKQIIAVGEGYGRNLANEFYGTGSLGRIEEANSPEELAALEALKKLAAEAGVQSDAVKALIGQQQGILTDAQKYSGLEEEALGVARNALSGLDAKENEGLRSQARQEIMRAFQAQNRQLARSQARNQVFGSAATAQNRLLGQDQVREQRNLERDLLVKNIDIKQAAQNAFSQLVTNTEANRAGRTNAASGQLSNTTLTDEANRKAAGLNAATQVGSQATSLADRVRQIREYNQGQAAAEKAGQVGAIIGGIGAISDQRGNLAGEEFADKQYTDSIEAQKRIEELLRQLIGGAKKDTGR